MPELDRFGINRWNLGLSGDNLNAHSSPCLNDFGFCRHNNPPSALFHKAVHPCPIGFPFPTFRAGPRAVDKGQDRRDHFIPNQRQQAIQPDRLIRQRLLIPWPDFNRFQKLWRLYEGDCFVLLSAFTRGGALFPSGAGQIPEVIRAEYCSGVAVRAVFNAP